MLSIDHISLKQTSLSGKPDRLSIDNVSFDGDYVNISFSFDSRLITNAVRSYLNNNDSYCTLTLFYRYCNQSCMPRYHTNTRRHTEAHKWCNIDEVEQRIRITMNSIATYTAQIDADYFRDGDIDDDHHKREKVDWDHYYKRFKLGLLIGSRGYTGSTSCYSYLNSDEIIVYYNNW